MKHLSQRTFFYFYDGKVKTFQIIVMMKDVPGALNSVLERLRDRVNLISSFSYSLEDGTAIWSGFGKALSTSETAEGLRQFLTGLKTVQDAEVSASNKGLLIDSFHVGLVDSMGVPRMVLSTPALRRVFSDVVQMFGSGGATLLFEEGLSMGKDNASFVKKLVGPGIARAKAQELLGMYAAMGWGVHVPREWKPGEKFTLKIDGCFECGGEKGSRASCDFQRGHLVGLLSSFYDVALDCAETKCYARGDPTCEFELRPSTPLTIR
jgi:predicted hydrocarbon binding protein